MHDENHQHLFFKCHYTQVCLIRMKTWLNIRSPALDLQLIIRSVQNGHITKFQKKIVQAGITVLVYMIWQHRNVVCWQQCVPSIDFMLKQIKSIIKHRVFVVLPKKLLEEIMSGL